MNLFLYTPSWGYFVEVCMSSSTISFIVPRWNQALHLAILAPDIPDILHVNTVNRTLASSKGQTQNFKYLTISYP